MTIVPGSPAPAFDMPTDGGARINSADLKGKTVVLYFYPKADTPGCTTEAQDFTALADDFAAANTVVIGVSRDAVRALDRFKTKRELGVVLASDDEGSVTEAFGVWGEKKLYGRVYMGIERATFLIDATGVVRETWRKVAVKGHAQAVLDAARTL
ncbi:Putative peroxiredoxin bcp [Brevundimonas sp. NIBR10]|uniref:thioredoxin-dependent thiol peroxidase n=1 Tax=Brevundimonas sp. NIBR10 TaxID=3015997 RepID=UPI0022F18D27|nr:thioredoxin-dependent thiol peroxidase [Brevundimonas sp. NIBR10]WGM46869.1 Putative peroxiredoxin bcp [Brevundimonas sp. NIBR10]